MSGLSSVVLIIKKIVGIHPRYLIFFAKHQDSCTCRMKLFVLTIITGCTDSLQKFGIRELCPCMIRMFCSKPHPVCLYRLRLKI